MEEKGKSQNQESKSSSSSRDGSFTSLTSDQSGTQPSPQKDGPTLEERKAQLTESTQTMFDNVSKYLQAELQATSEDFKLLETMNNVTREKYKDMTEITKNLTAFMDEMQKKYAEFEPYLKKIDEIDANVNELEHTVQLLDDYTRRLEEKFKKLALQRKEAKKKM
jgi:biogenesis of lysosome-related organelles complex 1 subunit 2